MTASELEFLERSLERQLSWVRAAESRISVILPLATALFGSVAAKTNTVVLTVCWEALAVGAALLSIALALIFAAVAVFPRTNGPSHSLIFFGGISSTSLENLKKRLEETEEDDLKEDLIEQIYVNASVASKKYTWIRRSMIALFVSLGPWAISVSLLY